MRWGRLRPWTSAERTPSGVHPPPGRRIYAETVAARRLIIIMLALLVLSSVAAALVPIDREALRDTPTRTASAPASPTGKLIEKEVDADVAAERQRIELRLGDSLALTVSSREPGLVEIGGLGLTEDVDPNEPAVFDLRPDERGSYPVRLIAPVRRPFALIEVGARRPAS